MLVETDEILEYDGSYVGFLCCVFYAFKQQTLPAIIASTQEEHLTLFSGKFTASDPLLAERIAKRLATRLSTETKLILKKGFLANCPTKERALIVALDYALTYGDSLERHTYQSDIQQLIKSIRQLDGEIHRYEGFTRFTEVNHVLFATISPEQYVLPFLMPFFAQRFPQESFVIYDKHHKLLGHFDTHTITLEPDVALPEVTLTEDELAIQQQWQVFFDAVAIKERFNPTLQKKQMPKRFWSDITEMQSVLYPS